MQQNISISGENLCFICFQLSTLELKGNKTFIPFPVNNGLSELTPDSKENFLFLHAL